MPRPDERAPMPARGSFESYVQRLRERQPFALTRWGDGEWSALLGLPGENCDGHLYSKRLRIDLRAILLARPTYELAIQQLALRRFGREIAAWLAERGLAFEWVNAETFARHSAAGELQPLVEALATRAVILVGPAHLAGIQRLFPVVQHIIVPERNCHTEVRRVTRDCARALAAVSEAVLAVSASMSANVIIDRLYRGGFAHQTLIDFGSLWEPYVGVATRSYHRRVLAQEGVGP